jgi:16S rRNA (cytidine1402-2'-O)-methyltransferase
MHADEKNNAELYVVATPIGNLRDITLRAIETLKFVDFIAAEDTRVTINLLRAHGISTQMLSLHKYNELQASEKILSMLTDGKSIALVSDAGTPAISDPGALLIEKVRSAGFRVTPIPGACAAIAALSASGLTDNGFLFYGFLPTKSVARKTIINELKTQPFSIVFYEAPHRIVELAEDLKTTLEADRQIVFAREITKRFETIHTCKVSEAVEWLQADLDQQRGEFVVIISGHIKEEKTGIDLKAQQTLIALLEELPLSQATSIAAKITGYKKNQLYELALQLKADDVQ